MDSSKRKERGGNESLKGQGGSRERSREGGTWRSQAWRQKGRGHKRGGPGGGRAGKGAGARAPRAPRAPSRALSLPPAGGAASRVLTARDPLQPQHVLRPDRLLPLQRPRPGPRACLRLRLGPGFGFRLQLRLGLHVRARGPWSVLRSRPGPAAALLHLHGLAGPRLACCRRGCLRRLEPREGGASAAPPPAGPGPQVPPRPRGGPGAGPAHRPPTWATDPGQGGGLPGDVVHFSSRGFQGSWLPTPSYSLASSHSALPSDPHVSSHLRAWDALPPDGLLSFFRSQFKCHLLRGPLRHPVTI